MQAKNLDKSTGQGQQVPLGKGLFIELIGGMGKKATKALLYRQGVFIKDVDMLDRVALRLFVVEAVDLGARKSYLAKAVGISRQSIDNHLEVRRVFGIAGLMGGYRSEESKDVRKQRKINKEGQFVGNKVRKVEELRAREREEKEQQQATITFEYPEGKTAEVKEHPFAEEHNWEKSRYAGTLLYLITLIYQWGWLRLIMSYFGDSYRIFMVFILMAADDIRSIEQLKHVHTREAGVVLGIKRIPSKPVVWEWFYKAAEMQVSGSLLKSYFRRQICCGLVGIGVWFTDGHLLPYTGKHRVHSAYNTQRRMPVPGRTGMVTCDGSGRIVDFEIQEGKGDLRAFVSDLGGKWLEDVPQKPVQVFDREGSGNDFFIGLVGDGTPFVTWEKNADAKKLEAIEDSRFTIEFELNGKSYGAFEGEKVLEEDATGRKIPLRRIYLWNKTSRRRTSGLACSETMTTEECARAILSRWGASENTFKHLNDRHPWHYHPGFKLVESERQDIANPQVKKIETIIAGIKKGLSSLYRKLAKAKEVVNADGAPRFNSARERLQQTISEQEAQLAKLNEEKKELAPRVNVADLEDYKSFKRIDNEGKYLFDFATISVWNARKQMVDWLCPHFTEKDELVDLFYAITNCHGWVKSTKTEITVRLEPLPQPRHRLAQEQLCRKLTSLMARTPKGKRFSVEVGDAPA